MSRLRSRSARRSPERPSASWQTALLASPPACAAPGRVARAPALHESHATGRIPLRAPGVTCATPAAHWALHYSLVAKATRPQNSPSDRSPTGCLLCSDCLLLCSEQPLLRPGPACAHTRAAQPASTTCQPADTNVPTHTLNRAVNGLHRRLMAGMKAVAGLQPRNGPCAQCIPARPYASWLMLA